MIESLSPYALLKRSKPRQIEAYITDYDLYSAAQQPHSPAEPIPIASFATQLHAFQAPTRYIAGIHQRHNQASKKTLMVSSALADHKSIPSVQQPLT